MSWKSCNDDGCCGVKQQGLNFPIDHDQLSSSYISDETDGETDQGEDTASPQTPTQKKSCTPPASSLPPPRCLTPNPSDVESAFQGRKKKYATAVFHGECCLSGITLTHEEDAVSSVYYRYNKWWIKPLYQTDFCEEEEESDEESESTRSSSFSEMRHKGRSECGEGGHGFKPGKRSRNHTQCRKEASRNFTGVREVINRVSQRQDEQGGGYISPSVISDSCHKEDGDQHAGNDHRNYNNDRTNAGPCGFDFGNEDGVTLMSALSFPGQPRIFDPNHRKILVAKARLLSSLEKSGGDILKSSCLDALDVLSSYYQTKGPYLSRSITSPFMISPSTRVFLDGQNPTLTSIDPNLTGTWLTLSKPYYRECLGLNGRGHHLYTLGRMSFDMFSPADLRCSIQSQFISIQEVDLSDDQATHMPASIPSKLKKEVLQCRNNNGKLKTYDIIISFNIEPNQTQKGKEISESSEIDEKEHFIPRPIKGIMTNKGYMLPDPKILNRFSIWFTGGNLEVNDEEADLEEWKYIFNPCIAPKRSLREQAHILAARVLLGASFPDKMDDDGTLNYEFQRPIGGHGLAYCDVNFLDEDLCILRGHHNQIYACARVNGGSSSKTSNGADRTQQNPTPSLSSPFQVIA